MGTKLKNILFAAVAFFLLVAIEAPSFIKLHHSFYGHKELKCDLTGNVQIHNAELDCDFQKFNVALHFILPQYHFDDTLVISLKEDHFNYYSFVSPFQQSHFSLRGPPISS